MDFTLTTVDPSMKNEIIDLNNANTPHVGFLTDDDFDFLFNNSNYFRAVLLNSTLVGFLIALDDKQNYQSPNYQWFLNNETNFIYVDRVAISSRFTNQGAGRLLYNDLFKFAMPHFSKVALEVNLQPQNKNSLNFHEKLGFKEVGSQWTKNDTIFVSLQVKTF